MSLSMNSSGVKPSRPSHSGSHPESGAVLTGGSFSTVENSLLLAIDRLLVVGAKADAVPTANEKAVKDRRSIILLSCVEVRMVAYCRRQEKVEARAQSDEASFTRGQQKAQVEVWIGGVGLIFFIFISFAALRALQRTKTFKNINPLSTDRVG